jgi:hypothetical protein
MKRYFLIFITIIFSKTAFAQNKTIDSAFLRHVESIAISTTDFNKLLPAITQPGKTDKDKLTLVYYWVYSHINFDIDGFLQSGPLQPLNISDALKLGKGECYEYNEFIEAACKYLKIQGYSIEGYVKYYGFEAGQSFTENNHVWFTAYLDGQWKMIDMLWACGTIAIKDGTYKFKKKLHQEYFLASPADFFDSHLPADPVWQFNNNPLSMSGFISKADGVDSTQRYIPINYADTIKTIGNLSQRDRELRSAVRGYNFNPANPNQLIAIYYNYAVELVNNPKATKRELIKARNYFIQSKLLISKSKDQNIQSLTQICEKGISSIENRLKYIKS